MPLYVRVRNRTLFREAVEARGTQVELAAAAGVSPQRVNQLINGPKVVRVNLRAAATMERHLGVPPGHLFFADPNLGDDIAVVGPYLAAHEDDDPDAPAAEPNDGIYVESAPAHVA